MTWAQKIKILFSLNQAVNKAKTQLENPTPMKLKPGIKTTEFWITLSLGLGSVLLGALGQIDGSTAAAAATILGAVYTAARGYLKTFSGQ
jgi:VanZ family protein